MSDLAAYVIANYKRVNDKELITPTGKIVDVRCDEHGLWIKVGDEKVYIDNLRIPLYIRRTITWRSLDFRGHKEYEISDTREVRRYRSIRSFTYIQSAVGGQRLVRILRKHYDLDHLYEQAFPDSLDVEWLEVLEERYDFVDRKKIFAIPPCERRFLMIYHSPHLLAEWIFERNVGIDLNTFRIGDKRKVYLQCPSVKEHFYQAYVNHRINRGGKCEECYLISVRIVSKDDRLAHIEAHNLKADTLTTLEAGDAAEEYIVTLLEPLCDIQRIGHLSNSKFDALASVKNEEQRRGLQIKMLLPRAGKNAMYVDAPRDNKFSTFYPSGTLLLMVDKSRTRFQIAFTDDIDKPTLSCATFLTEEQFLERFTEYLPRTIIIEDISLYMTPKYLEEYNSILRLRQACLHHGLTFRYNNTNSTVIDFYINEYRIQAKFSRLPSKDMATYRIHLSKSACSIASRQIHQPYSIDEPIDFVIAEVGGTEADPTCYQGHFCIFPKQWLIDQGYIASEASLGKLCMKICPPDYDKAHASKAQWGAFDLLV